MNRDTRDSSETRDTRDSNTFGNEVEHTPIPGVTYSRGEWRELTIKKPPQSDEK